jgi:ATP-dependent DNA helicase RecG
MTRDESWQLITDVQTRQSELANVEVKAAHGGTPRRLYEPLSAFANRTGSGILLLRLNESSDFSIVGVSDARWLREEIIEVAHVSSRVSTHNKGIECEHPASE